MLAPVLTVSMSVCHKWVFYRNGWTDGAGFWHRGFLRPDVHSVLRKFMYLQYKGTFLCNFENLTTAYRSSRRVINLAGQMYVDAQSVMNWTVVGQLNDNTSDGRPLVCHSDCQALSTARFRRAGSSDSWYLFHFLTQLYRWRSTLRLKSVLFFSGQLQGSVRGSRKDEVQGPD